MLKFEGIPVGTKVKAFDFRPMEDRPDSYMVGYVIGKTTRNHAKFLVLDLTKHIVFGRPVSIEGDEGIGYVPMELAWGEFDERVTTL